MDLQQYWYCTEVCEYFICSWGSAFISFCPADFLFSDLTNAYVAIVMTLCFMVHFCMLSFSFSNGHCFYNYEYRPLNLLLRMIIIDLKFIYF